MEILKAATAWKLDVECTGKGNNKQGCGSLLRISIEDLRHFEEQEYPWRIAQEALCFKCPVCLNITDIKKEDWPINHERLTKFTTAWRDGEERCLK